MACSGAATTALISSNPSSFSSRKPSSQVVASCPRTLAKPCRLSKPFISSGLPRLAASARNCSGSRRSLVVRASVRILGFNLGYYIVLIHWSTRTINCTACDRPRFLSFALFLSWIRSWRIAMDILLSVSKIWFQTYVLSETRDCPHFQDFFF